MGRKPTEFGATVDAEIAIRTARGESAETVAAALGMQSQLSTIRRRQAKLKGRPHAKVSPPRPTAVATGSSDPPRTNAPEIAADVPDVVPPETTTEQLERWIKKLDIAANAAEENKNWAAFASISAKAAMLMGLKHRLTPIPKPDPNDNPDFRALAKTGEKRLLALLHDVFPSQ